MFSVRFAGNGLWHHHVLGGQQCGSAEGALCVPFDCRRQAGSANQLHRGQSNVGLIRGLLPRRWVDGEIATPRLAASRCQFASSYNCWWANQYGLKEVHTHTYICVCVRVCVWPQLKQCSAWPETSSFFLGWTGLVSVEVASLASSAKWKVEIMEHVYENVVSCSAFQTHLKYMSELKCTLAVPAMRTFFEILSYTAE